MNKLFVIFVAVVLLFGGYLFLSKNQSKTNIQQESKTAITSDREEVSENKDQEEMKKEDEAESKDQNKEEPVSLTESGFDPQTISVKAGTKVVWKNDTKSVANVSSDKHPTHLLYPPLNLGSFESGDTVSLIFKDKGSFGYHNHLNPAETGTVVVN